LLSAREGFKPITDVLEPESPARYENFPVGNVVLTAKREGFADYREEFDVAPATALTHAILMSELRGSIEVTCNEGGFRVRVVDRWGEARCDEFTLGTDPAQVDVRTGELEVEASKPGFESMREKVEVVAGKSRQVSFAAVREKVLVSFRSKAPFDGDIEFRESGGGFVRVAKTYLRDGDTSRVTKLEPGSYRLVYERAGGTHEKSFDVSPDAVGTSIVVDLDS
jgi:hypothetical protein